MPNASSMRFDTDSSFLLVGDGGTHKTYFLRTLPRPIYVFDFDKGMSINAGQDMDYDTFKEVPEGETLGVGGRFQGEGWYTYGAAYPAFLKKINEIGRSIDNGTCPYKSIGVDSLTTLTIIAQSYILKQNSRKQMERNDWGAFLRNMTELFSQFSGWPLIKVLTAHIKRDENPLTNSIEKLPMVPGQFQGVVPTLFDEVYYTETKLNAQKKPEWVLRTLPDGMNRQAKSRKYNIPDGTPTDFAAVMKHIEGRVAT